MNCGIRHMKCGRYCHGDMEISSCILRVSVAFPILQAPQAMKKLYFKTRHFILYGLLLAVLVFVLKWFQWKFLIIDNSWDIYIGLLAIFFTALGVWIATQITKRRIKTVVVEKEVYIESPTEFEINEAELKKLNLSNREYEVLQLLSRGYSNADIASNLFLSLSTVKTHVSNILLKMDVKSRAQAIEKAKRLRLTA
jgi:DNA-binding CsgD family transcriptional regulator